MFLQELILKSKRLNWKERKLNCRFGKFNVFKLSVSSSSWFYSKEEDTNIISVLLRFIAGTQQGRRGFILSRLPIIVVPWVSCLSTISQILKVLKISPSGSEILMRWVIPGYSVCLGDISLMCEIICTFSTPTKTLRRWY